MDNSFKVDFDKVAGKFIIITPEDIVYRTEDGRHVYYDTPEQAYTDGLRIYGC